MNEQAALAALRDPATSARTLADISYYFPHLRSSVLHHPQCYPELAEWIAQNPDIPAAPASVTARGTMATAQGIGTEGAPLADGARPHGSRKKLVAAGSALTLLIAGLGGGTWWFTHRDEPAAQSHATSYSKAPSVTQTIRLTTAPSQSTQLSSLGESTVLTDGSTTVIGLRDPDTDTTTMVAFSSDTDVAYPQWTTTIASDDAASCTITDGDVTCGEEAVALDTGWQNAYPIKTEIYRTPTVSTDYPDLSHEASDAPSTSSTGVASASPSASDSPSDTTTATSDASTPMDSLPSSEKVSTDAREDLPFSFEDGELLTADATPLTEFDGATLWALPAPEDSSTWVFSDGNKIAAVHDDALAWEKFLDDDAATLNQFTSESPS